MRNVSTKLKDNYSQHPKRFGARGWRERQRYITEPVKSGQEPAPPVPGSNRSSGFIVGTFTGYLDQVIR